MASKATLPHTFIMVVMFSKLNAYVGSETCSCTIPAKDTCHVQYLLAYGCKECLPCSKKPLLGGGRHHACRRFSPPEEKIISSRGRIIFLPRENAVSRDAGKAGSTYCKHFSPMRQPAHWRGVFHDIGEHPRRAYSVGRNKCQRTCSACMHRFVTWMGISTKTMAERYPGHDCQSGTPHRGMNVHMTDDNTEKIGKFPCSIGGKSVTLHANSGFMRDI